MNFRLPRPAGVQKAAVVIQLHLRQHRNISWPPVLSIALAYLAFWTSILDYPKVTATGDGRWRISGLEQPKIHKSGGFDAKTGVQVREKKLNGLPAGQKNSDPRPVPVPGKVAGDP